MRTLMSDVRYGLRQLRRAPTFTLVAVLSLALGIGVNTALFSVVHALLLKPLPLADPERLVSIYTSDFSGPVYGASSYADARDFADGAPALAGLASTSRTPLAFRTGGDAERVFAEVVSPGYFDVLGVGASPGRPFTARGGADPADQVVISHRFWMRRFGGDPAVIGRTVVVDGRPRTVTGVADRAFTSSARGIDADLFVPLVATGEDASARGNRGFMLVGRLAPGAGPATVQAQLEGVAARLHREHPDAWTDVTGARRRVTVTSLQTIPGPPGAASGVTAFFGMLSVLMALVLLVACANVAGLLLARAAGRRQEIAVRLSLGAGRWRIVRQLLTEAALLALLAGAGGLLAAQWTVALLEQLRPPVPVPLVLEFPLDIAVLVYTLALSFATGLAFGLAPALQATRLALLPALQRAVPALGTSRRLALRNLLVVGQVAVSLVLVVLAALFVRSLQRAADIDLGFEPSNILIASLDTSITGYEEAQGLAVYEQVLDRVRAMPGVASATLAQQVPLSLEGGRRGMRPDNYERRPGEDMEVPYNLVAPGYFATLGIPVLKGRDFTAGDREGTEPVIVVNEAFVQRYWPGQDPLLRRISITGDEGPRLRVIGVAGSTRHFSLQAPPPPMIYIPFLQQFRPAMRLYVRTGGPVAAAVPLVREAIRSVDPGLPMLNAVALADQASVSLLPQRVAASFVGAFGGLAVLLAVMGLYGVLAQTVSQRTREIGIRLALGAEARSIARLVLRQGWRLCAAGLAIGVLLAGAGARLVSSFLAGATALDPLAWIAAGLLMTAAASLAMWVPARRAAAIDPASTLRYE